MADCLVTGGCGFIGSHLVEGLVRAGHSVRVLDDLSTGHRENLGAVEEQVELLEGSVTDVESVRAAVRGVDCVFHLAALPSVQRSLEDPATTHAVCATGTLHVLEAARKEGARRVVYAASSSAYGDAPGIKRHESDQCRPLSPYAAAKLAGEHYCQSFTRSFGLETVRLRFFNVFGPRQRADSPYAAVVAKFIAALGRGETPVIHGDGQQSRDFTFVDDAVQALLLAATASRAVGNVYNVGCGARTSIQRLAQVLGKLVGQDVSPVHTEARSGDVRHSWADLTRAREDLGYRPRVPVLEGLRRTVEAFQVEARASVLLFRNYVPDEAAPMPDDRLTVICHFRNEEFYLPYWLRHHSRLFDHGILIDYHSTDRSRAIIRELTPTWEVRTSRNQVFHSFSIDEEVMEVEREVSGWKMCLNVTEFVLHYDLKEFLRDFEKRHPRAQGLLTTGFVIQDSPEQREAPLTGDDLWKQRHFGCPEPDPGDNGAICRSRLLHRAPHGGYCPGRHANQVSAIKDPPLYLFWYGWCPLSMKMRRNRDTTPMVRASDLLRGWGIHHVLTDEQLLEVWRDLYLPHCSDLLDGRWPLLNAVLDRVNAQQVQPAAP